MCDAAQAIWSWGGGVGGVGPVRRRLFECGNRLSVIGQQHLGGSIGIAECCEQRRYPQRR